MDTKNHEFSEVPVQLWQMCWPDHYHSVGGPQWPSG